MVYINRKISMKRLLSKITTTLLLVLLTAAICHANPSITVGSASATPGSTIAIPVTFNSDGLTIVDIDMSISYDSSKLSYIGCEQSGSACPANDFFTVQVTNATATSTIRLTIIDPTVLNPIPTGLSSGELAKFIFAVSPTTPAGQIELTTSILDVSDADLNTIATTKTDGIITIPDTTAPTLTTPFMPASYTSVIVPITLNATDNVAVTGYCVSESQDPGNCSWSSIAPTSYNFSGISILVPTQKTLYAFAKDAAGNIGSASASVMITIPDTTPPVVTAFSGPPTSTSATISGIILSATDNMSVSGYCLSETADYSGCVWSATPPTSFTFKNVTQGIATDMVLYAWANDGTNVSQPASFTVTITIPLKVLIITIDGNGTVNSDANINCSGSLCIKGFPTDTVVTLMPTPGTSSIFSGWSGDCTNTSGNCVLTMTTDKNVKATFQLTPPVCINYPSSCYQTLQDAYDNAADGSVIRLKTGTLTGTLLAARAITATVEGGYDAGYTGITGETIFDGYVKVRSGKINMRKVLVK